MKLQLTQHRNDPDLCECKRVKESNPLLWWKKKRSEEGKCEDVWELAEDCLAVPATSASSERAFSTAGNTITMRRCRSKESMVSSVVLLRENMDVLDDLIAAKSA